MKFAFISAEKAHFPVQMLCQVLEVSRGGFYEWLRRGESPRAKENQELLVAIQESHEASGGTYGSPRICVELREQGKNVGEHRVARLMRSAGIQVHRKRRFVTTTDSRHGLPVAPNLLDRRFNPDGPNQVWATDITHIATGEGWLYLAAVLDLYSRRVVGWSTGGQIDRHLVLRALDVALQDRSPPRGLMHHSDRGSQYASEDYRKALEQRGILCSMSRKGNCWDNAVAESFFATLKKDCIYRQEFSTREEGKAGLFKYIEIFYNRKRRHSSLGYKTPVEYENVSQSDKMIS